MIETQQEQLHLQYLQKEQEIRMALARKYGKKTKVLDKGWVRFVNILGSDQAFTDAARGSYQDGTKKVNNDSDLLRMLVRSKHTSPIEFGEIVIQVRVPMSIGEQWLRHRTANVNKESGRYSIMKNEVYTPTFKPQSKTNRQGANGDFDEEEQQNLQDAYEANTDYTRETYELLIQEGVAREQARFALPAGQYCTMMWKIDCHNLMNFMRLRLEHHAQYEIRAFTEPIAEMVKAWVPNLWAAFEDYVLESVTFSRAETVLLKKLLDSEKCGFIKKINHKGVDKQVFKDTYGMTPREMTEFKAKLTKITT